MKKITTIVDLLIVSLASVLRGIGATERVY